MRRVAILMTIQLISAAVGLCQTRIPLVDISAAASPVRISGTVLFQDDPSTTVRYTYLIDGSVTDVSNKRIVLTIIHISATGVDAPGLDNTVAVERFFGPNDLKPGGIEGIDPTPIKFGPGNSAEVGPLASPSATAELIFLQFADGSTWGDVDAGRPQLSVRAKTMGELHRLGQILNDQGAVALKDELSRVDLLQFPSINSLVYSCTNKTAVCLTNGLRSMLKEAELHEDEMKALSRSAMDAFCRAFSPCASRDLSG